MQAGAFTIAQLQISSQCSFRLKFRPNGYLHIGQAKAMFTDFGLAKERSGHCYLRFDDTNPEAEKKEYIDHIQEIVQWISWEPYKVTYTGDYFQDFYELAVCLMQKELAYVDHQEIVSGSGKVHSCSLPPDQNFDDGFSCVANIVSILRVNWLEELELLALAANRDLQFSYNKKPDLVPIADAIKKEAAAAGGPWLPLPATAMQLFAQGSENSLFYYGR